MADYTLSDLNGVSAIAEDDLLHVRNTSGLDKKITWAALKNLMDPVGTIKMFDGATWTDNVTIVGWYACISANAGQGCPNLVDQFIKGGTIATVLDVGGAATVTLAETHLPSHTHSLSSHTHVGAAHTHTSAAHTHTLSSHTHVGAAHTHAITHNHAAASTGAHIHTFPTGSQSATNGAYERQGINAKDTSSTTPSINLPSFSGTSGARSASTSAGPNTNTSGSTTPGVTGGRSASTSGAPSNNTSGTAGSGSAHNNEPQYYKLIFIRKCS